MLVLCRLNACYGHPGHRWVGLYVVWLEWRQSRRTYSAFHLKYVKTCCLAETAREYLSCRPLYEYRDEVTQPGNSHSSGQELTQQHVDYCSSTGRLLFFPWREVRRLLNCLFPPVSDRSRPVIAIFAPRHAPAVSFHLWVKSKLAS